MSSKSKSKPSPSPIECSFDAEALEAPADQALAQLKRAGDRAASLLEAWVARQNAAAVHAISTSDSAHRKAARRALSVLKSRGVAVPDVKAPAPTVSPSELTHEAWFVPSDTGGVAIYTLSSHSVGERWSIAELRVHDQAGLVHVSAGEATRSSIRNGFQELKSQRGLSPTPVPSEWARWRVARGRERNQKSGMVMPLGLDGAAPLLGPVPESEPAHPIDRAQVAVDEGEIEKRAQASASLHNEPEFASWLPDLRVVQELLAKVGEHMDPSAGEQKPEQVNALLNEQVVAATDRFFTPDFRNVIALRMKDAAISVLARAGRERALDVLATAEAAKRAGLITSPPSDIPFLRAFFQKALAVVASSSGGRLSIPVPKGAQPPAAESAPAEQPPST